MIRISKVNRSYKMGSGEICALVDLSLFVEAGDFLAIMGPSGSGKSTLMNIIGCLDKPSAGQYLLDGADVGNLDENSLAGIRSSKIGFIFQTFNLIPRMNALKNVEMPLIYNGHPRGKERLMLAEAALESVGLRERIYHKPNELSGGQQQRVAIARALANNPSVILADEPTGNLDSSTGEEIMNIFLKLNRDGKTIIMVTHDEAVGHNANRIVRLKDGRIVCDGKPS